MTILSLKESVDEATKTFCTFTDGKPDLVPTGIRGIDSLIGGLFPGSAGIIAAATGVGKSSIVLSAALGSTAKVGIISTEDTPDVVGSRTLAYLSGVDSLRIRTKSLTSGERSLLAEAAETSGNIENVRVAYEIGSPLEAILEAIDGLASFGCRLVWLDYIQKIRGVREDRRNEVSAVYTAVQRACGIHSMALLAVSQFSRQPDPTRPPQIYWLKESGDLENEARLILLASRDGGNPNSVSLRVAKSTFGGEGATVQFIRDSSGGLREVGPIESEPF